MGEPAKNAFKTALRDKHVQVGLRLSTGTSYSNTRRDNNAQVKLAEGGGPRNREVFLDFNKVE